MFSTTLLETLDCTWALLAFSFSPRDLHSTCSATAFVHGLLPWQRSASMPRCQDARCRRSAQHSFCHDLWLHKVYCNGKVQGATELLSSLCRWVSSGWVCKGWLVQPCNPSTPTHPHRLLHDAQQHFSAAFKKGPGLQQPLQKDFKTRTHVAVFDKGPGLQNPPRRHYETIVHTAQSLIFNMRKL